MPATASMRTSTPLSADHSRVSHSRILKDMVISQESVTARTGSVSPKLSQTSFCRSGSVMARSARSLYAHPVRMTETKTSPSAAPVLHATTVALFLSRWVNQNAPPTSSTLLPASFALWHTPNRLAITPCSSDCSMHHCTPACSDRK